MKDAKIVFNYFLIWRLVTLTFAFLGIYFLDNKEILLGGGLENYLSNPLFWGWANFDGEHYLRIINFGYQPLTHFFFPLYPLIIYLVAKTFFTVNYFYSNLIGIIISNVSFFIALLGFYKLLKLDFSKKVINLTILSLIFFPTSFYYGALYTESLYLTIIVWSFYFIRTSNYFKGFFISAFSSAIRVVGISLSPALFFEIVDIRKIKTRNIFWLVFPWLGIIAYMYYLYSTTGEPMMFNKHGDVFGEYRSDKLILLPQVFYRYIFKVLPNLNYLYFEGTFPILLELFVAIFLLISSVYGFFKLRFSYWVYLIIGYLMPPLYNSFVSMPRYAVVLFPMFILIAMFLENKNMLFKLSYFVFSGTLLFVSTAFFINGIWIS